MTENTKNRPVAHAADPCPPQAQIAVGPAAVAIYKRMMAMLIVLTMQASTDPMFPNLALVAASPNPPENPDETLLQDLFAQIGPDMFCLFNKDMAQHADTYNAVIPGLAHIITRVAALVPADIWQGSFPHDAKNRDLVAALLP